jgi:hypothetical protein
MRKRQPAPEIHLKPKPSRVSERLRGGAYDGPHVNKGRTDIKQVEAYTPGHKGKSQKLRPKWPY